MFIHYHLGAPMQVKTKPLLQLKNLFAQKSCWTIKQLHEKMDYSAISIRRFLKQVGYYSSFTHNSKWYTLHSIANFDKNGLWFYEDIGFSKHGNLKQTIVYFIDKSPQGLSANELEALLSTPLLAILNHIYKSGAIERIKDKSKFVYISSAARKKKRQLMRLEAKTVIDSEPQKLNAHSAVYVLVEYIQNPQATFDELSKAVAKKQVIAKPKAIARFFEEHDLKKTRY